MMASGAYQQHEPRGVPRVTDSSANRTPLQTQNVHQDRRSRFSWEAPTTQTHNQIPLHQHFHSPSNSSIDDSSPLATEAPQQPMSTPPQDTPRQQYASYPPEKVPVERLGSPHSPSAVNAVHPAHFAPYAEENQAQRYSSTMGMSDLAAPQQQWNSPHDDRKVPPPVPDASSPLDYKPPTISTPRLTPKTPTYDPHSLTGPNSNLDGNHLPGQVSHPNAVVNPSWKHGMCEMDTLCCTSLFCPCIVYGKSQYRLSQKAHKREATDLLGYSSTNSSCGLMAVACGFQWLLAAVQRTRVRKVYHLEGSIGDDCVKGLCCCCCVLAQNEREVQDREQLLRRNAGPVNTAAYSSPTGGMLYAPPPR